VTSNNYLDRIADGRTDLVFEYLAEGHAANSTDQNRVPLIKSCAYYGDVSAIKLLLSKGESLSSRGENFGLSAAAFHGHWRLCEFLLESGADVNHSEAETGETALHVALSKSHSTAHALVVKVLLARGTNPNAVTKSGIETGAFMRDCRTKGETPLHRAAAFANEETIQLLLDAGAKIDAKDVNGDSPLGWASWYLRPDPILRKLCYNGYSIRPNRLSMEAYLLGKPHAVGNSKA
jgi:ankyrin repeat protein